MPAAARSRPQRASGVVGRARRSWRSLAGEQRLAGLAAFGLLASMLLPWYQRDVTAVDGGRLIKTSDNLSAFGAFSFVEAAVLLVSGGVLVLLFARGEGRAFHLPGGDGVVITVAGAWAALLFFWRLFDKPDAGGGDQITASIGIQWGFLVAFAAAGALALAGARVRAAHRPEPPLPPEVAEEPVREPASPPGRDGAERRRPDARRAEDRRTAVLPAEIPEPADPPPADRLF